MGAFVSSEPAPVGVTVVLWRPDLRVFAWACDGLAGVSPAPSVLRVHVNETDDPALVESVRSITARVPAATYVTSSHANLGFARGHNDLLAQCFGPDGCGAVVVLNPDVRLEPGSITRLLRHAGDGEPVVLGPLLELVDRSSLVPTGRIDSAGIRWSRSGRHFDDRQGRPLADAPFAPTRVAGVTGACMFVGRAAYERISAASGEFFDADFIAYREDAELALRAHELGVEQWLVPDARALHVRGHRGTARGESAFVDYLGVRNRFLIAFKYGHRRPGGLTFAPLRDLVVILAVLLKERSSVGALRDAWRLRDRMRSKRRCLDAYVRALRT